MEGERTAEMELLSTVVEGDDEVGTDVYIPWTNYRYKDSDQLFEDIYYYYSRKGFMSIILSKLSSSITSLFIALFSVWFVTFIDFGIIIEKSSLAPAMKKIDLNEIHPFIILCLLFFFAFWLWEICYKFLFRITGWRAMKVFYNTTLKINEEDLPNTDWVVISRQIQKIHNENTRLIEKQRITPLDMTNIIMRKENFMLALFNQRILSFHIPLPFLRRYSFYTHTLEIFLLFIFNQTIFLQNPSNLSSSSPLSSPSSSSGSSYRNFRLNLNSFTAQKINRYFILLSIVVLIFSPWILCYLLLVFIFQNGEEIKNRTSDSIFALRFWSLSAQHKIRNYNELRHFFLNRLNASLPDARAYVDEFKSETFNIVGRFFSFFVSFALLFFFVMSLLPKEQETFLFTPFYLDKPLFFYITVLGISLNFLRNSLFISNERIFNAKQYLTRVVSIISYQDGRWRGRESEWGVRDLFTNLFEFKIITLLKEIISVIIVPLMMMRWGLSGEGENLVRWMREVKIAREGVGEVLIWSDFEAGWEKGGDEMWSGNNNVNRGQGEEEMKGRAGKMERSFVGFVGNHPDYEVKRGGGRELLEGLVEWGRNGKEAEKEEEWGSNIMDEMKESVVVSRDWEGDWRRRSGRRGKEVEEVRRMAISEVNVLQSGFHEWKIGREEVRKVGALGKQKVEV
eukprot:TRINITY_DN5316_c0_g1_i1.p1 TRINITY_DN5316_c0_g1~~TRINITY_DN5316_c0_g1_i1.p1  ORF type:complete len:680 (-),score=157.79 TRINITY_DN5316_c0_g1_i1:82-2121(-)